MISKNSYQPEIDALRFISVLPVIFFHLDFSVFKGGFLGVDIFFVISGYLISKIIINDLIKKKFSLKKFYLRRARRILPALLVTILFTLILSFIFFFPEEHNYLYKTVISSFFFFSNFFFFKTTDYFNDLSSQSPLLHTWSLSVEEQFYILYPIFLILLLRKFKIQELKFFFIIIFFISLFLASYFSINHKDGSFFLTPFRIFEIVLGCLLYFYNFNLKINTKNKNFVCNIICICSLLLILFSFIFFSKNSLLPSYLTLIPILSTCFLIINLKYCSPFFYNFFTNKFFVFGGKISYSLYLIHFPLIIFFVYDKSLLNIFFFFSILIFLSFLSWKFVENPMRNKNYINDKYFTKILSISVLFLFILMFLINIGSKNRINYKFLSLINSDKENNLYLQINQVKNETLRIQSINFNECIISTIDLNKKFLKEFNKCKKNYDQKFYLFLGDSHALDLFLSFKEVTKKKFIVGLLPQGCRPALEFDKCKSKYEAYKNFINMEKENIKYVFFTQSGSKFLRDLAILPIEKKVVNKTFEYLDSLNLGDKLLWIGPNIEPNITLNYKAIRIILNKKIDLYENKFVKDVDKYLLKKSYLNNINYLSRISLMEYDSKNNFFYNGNLTYRDNDHWSEFGLNYFGKKIFLDKKFERYLYE